jgi:hypothetical protein
MWVPAPALARARPSTVRAMISSRSNSADAVHRIRRIMRTLRLCGVPHRMRNRPWPSPLMRLDIEREFSGLNSA